MRINKETSVKIDNIVADVIDITSSGSQLTPISQLHVAKDRIIAIVKELNSDEKELLFDSIVYESEQNGDNWFVSDIMFFKEICK